MLVSTRCGGPDRFRSFLMERAEHEDVVIQTISRKLLTTFTLLERRVTSVGSAKKSSSAKIQEQRVDIMQLMYEICKFQSRASKKRSLVDVVDARVLREILGEDIMIAIVKLSSTGVQSIPRVPVAMGPMGAPICPVDTAYVTPKRSGSGVSGAAYPQRPPPPSKVARHGPDSTSRRADKTQAVDGK